MKENSSERFYEDRDNMCALFINFDMEAALDKQYYWGGITQHYVDMFGSDFNVPVFIYHSAPATARKQGFVDTTEYLRWSTWEALHAQMCERGRTWTLTQERRRIIASRRMRERFERTELAARPFYNATTAQRYKNDFRVEYRAPLPPVFQILAERMRSTIRAERSEDYAGIRKGKEAVLSVANLVTMRPTTEAQIVRDAVWKRWPALLTALDLATLRMQTGHWVKPVWHESSWANKYPLHFAHASRETPGNIAFYPDVAKMEADKLTSMKPGRYLSTFYSDALDDNAVKEWSNMQQQSTAPATLKFVDNTDPDGWVWVYENSSPSCMRYNRTNRYMDINLCDENHPVRAYAHPKNSLALAYIMLPGEKEDRSVNCKMDAYVIAARTIVNVSNKTYLRIYADDDRYRTALHNALRDAGYSQGSYTLEGQRLVRRYYGSDTICPYLDGNYTNVDLVAEEYMVVNDSGYDGQQSSGLLGDSDEDSCYCSWCDTHHNEDDGSYIDSVGEWVCDDCNVEDFVDAVSYNGRTRRYPKSSGDIVYCDYNSTYYVSEYLDNNNMGEDENSGEIYPLDMLVSTSRGLVYVDDTTRLTYAYEGDARAHYDDVYRLPDGETCHVEDTDKIADLDPQQEAA
jgi:hypothetical protein